MEILMITHQMFELTNTQHVLSPGAKLKPDTKVFIDVILHELEKAKGEERLEHEVEIVIRLQRPPEKKEDPSKFIASIGFGDRIPTNSFKGDFTTSFVDFFADQKMDTVIERAIGAKVKNLTFLFGLEHILTAQFDCLEKTLRGSIEVKSTIFFDHETAGGPTTSATNTR